MADREDAIPVRVGYYDLVRTIGRGNFAIVKLARHALTNSKIAIKVIATRALDAEQRRKLQREVDIMKRVGAHRHIVRLYQVMQSERHVMLVTEFCAGGEIFDQLVANGRMPETGARHYFQQIVAAVAFLHEHGIVHRDLKAENLLLSADLKVVKLADFGFSNYYSRDALLSTWCGSPPYAAPELFEGRHYSGPKADVWSLGVVLYVLVCGALPFDGHTLQSLKGRVLAGKFRIPYFMSCDCEHLIRHMLVTDPDRRFSLAQIRAHRWLRVAPPAADALDSDSGDSDSAADSAPAIDMSIVDWVSRELSVDTCEVLESVRTRAYDHNYALYHLVSDSSHATPSSAPPSPPLLPLIPSTNQRKSSITTGVVERDTPSAGALTAGASPHRRHTFGPDTNASCSSSQTALVTPPLLFLTPPAVPPLASLALAPPNYPITNMDLLRPPPVLLMVNNNMGRRASDGQANYARTCAPVESSAQNVSCSASAFNFPQTSSSTQTSPPISYHRRKRHSLTDANDLVSRFGRRSGLANIINSANNERSRRRASDGSAAVTAAAMQSSAQARQHQISIASLQTELRALCVSSPPSLQTSPIHVSTPTTTTAPAATAASPSAVPSSPPPSLPLISEELLQSSAHAQHGSSTCSPVPLLTPPHSFRSVEGLPSPHAPAIAVTDELGTLQFPILPPPVDFQHVTSQPNLERGAAAAAEEAASSARLHRWRNEESRRDSYITCRTLRQTYPPSAPVAPPPPASVAAAAAHYTSLQCLRGESGGPQSPLQTTGSGSIVLDDSSAAKLLRRLQERRAIDGTHEHVLICDDIRISLEWSRQSLVLRRVSGDHSHYKDVCRQLIADHIM